MVDHEEDNEGVVELEEGDALELPPRSPVVVKTNEKCDNIYKSLDELGKGKFGVVKRAERKSDKVHFAAKYIKKTPNSKKEVLREIEMMNHLHHKRLISLYDAFETSSEMIIIMELVTGGELFEKVVEEDNLTEKQVIRYTRQILYGVQHMHRKHMVHLDLKPENILCLGGEKPGYEQIKLIDFGMTRVIVDGEEESAICGTPEFVAPEVINYDPVTVASDMWSIGVIIYVLLSGLSPFMGDDDNETLANVSAGEYDFEDDEDEEDGVFSSLSDDVKQFISELLLLDPEKRLTVDQSLDHKWLQSEGNEKKLDVGNLKKFIARRRWQKTTNTIKAVSRLAGGLNLFSGGKERTHGHEPGSFLDKVKKQEQKEREEEERAKSGDASASNRPIPGSQGGRKVFGMGKGGKPPPPKSGNKLW